MSQLGKVKAFSLSSSAAKKVLGKKDLEKQKKLQDEVEAAKAYQDFVETFEDTPKQTKFVRGNVINSANGEELSSNSSGKLYKPNKLHELETKKSMDSSAKPSAYEPLFKSEKPAKKKSEVKKKSNLELFKEELKLIQEEREERHRLKSQMKESGVKLPAVKTEAAEVGVKLADDYRIPTLGSFDTGDPNTTNIYLGNLNPKMTEPQLCQLFGKYGPLASVKIMWPRSDEERSRNRNCGFVAFMNRKDGERALKTLNGKEIMEYEMKLGWGKAVPIPPHPIYIPPALMELTMPPPQSGLPFNAQPDPNETIPRDQWNDKENFEKMLQNSIVKVVVPTDRTLLCLIHRMVEFVVREGPMFEAMIMNREISNPTFRFLFDNQSPAHVYYRWRLFSVLQGEHPSKWRTEEFRMFENGSVWKPPPLNPFLQGMPEELVEASPPPSPERVERQKRKPERREARQESKKGMLSETQRDKLEDMLRNLTPQKSKICETMVYCIDHSESAEEIVDCIAESLSIVETPLYKKIARLYLISDILHNCSVKVTNVSFFRKGFQSRLNQIFHDIHDCYNDIEGRLKAEHFKQRVMACFRAWEEQAIYSPDFLIKLQNIFLGLVQREAEVEPKSENEDDVDGVPIGEADIDGVPIDIDGEPIISADSASLPKFKPSKWETVDPDVVEAQAMTTSKWETLEQTNEDNEDIDGKPFDPSPTQSGEDSRGSMFLEALKHELSNNNPSKRAKLREIEVKVLRYQDELESGKRSRKSGHTVSQMVEEYRRKLLKREKEDNSDDLEADRRSGGHSPRSRRRSRSRSRSRSPRKSSRDHDRARHRSRSPTRKRRSPSPHKRRK
ncbi:unnamed protein product [Medioppia subpectinata]|uniref:U2 snRNP-associated SURP motif-containing protein n=1 Tax=Medioppia subpectinata TaxID=1979941 RepID=A0A7R9Q6H9_9ACAR|nr:unnamed protein product [Medioppia subpectinata]CAG2113273.1 unnamed protein product [Medioppia subpectinata]